MCVWTQHQNHNFCQCQSSVTEILRKSWFWQALMVHWGWQMSLLEQIFHGKRLWNWLTIMLSLWRRYEEDVDDILPLAYGMSLQQSSVLAFRSQRNLFWMMMTKLWWSLHPGWTRVTEGRRAVLVFKLRRRCLKRTWNHRGAGLLWVVHRGAWFHHAGRSYPEFCQTVVGRRCRWRQSSFLDGTESNFMAQVSLHVWQGH